MAFMGEDGEAFASSSRFNRIKSSRWTFALVVVVLALFVATIGYYVGYGINYVTTSRANHYEQHKVLSGIDWNRHAEEHKALNQIFDALNKEAAARQRNAAPPEVK